jgi:uncharacterized repeat protein (TIGR01451 family)
MRRAPRALIGLACAACVYAFAPATAGATVSFSGPTNFPAGSNPVGLASGDFNGDNDPDLAVTNFGSTMISILLGGAGGSFSAPTSLPVGSDPYAVAVGDFNGDNDPDLAVANVSSNNVSILLGAAGGTFTGPTNYATGNGAISVAVGDFNGDNDPDLAVANSSGGVSGVSILVGAAGGTFTGPTNMPAGANPWSVAVGDFNGDNDPDLAVTNLSSNNVSIFLGGAGASFSGPTNFPAGGGPTSVAVGDFNGDNDPDLAISNQNTGGVSILAGAAGGTFSSPTSISTSGAPQSVAVGNLNGDSDPDLAVANLFSNISVLEGAAGATFSGPTNFTAGVEPFTVAIADFNGDSKPDIAVTDVGSSNVLILLNTSAFADATPPTLNLPSNITVEAEGPDGSNVDFNVSATDDTDPNPSVSCDHNSGDLFPIGTTTVNCTATDADGNVANGSFTVTVTDTKRADLELHKTANKSQASPGEQVTYTFTVTNHGPNDAHHVTVRDPLSEHLEFVSGDPGCSFNQELVCDFGTLPNGASASKSFVAKIHNSHNPAEPPDQHTLSVIKVEESKSLPPFVPSQYHDESVSCPSGYITTDGSARTDSVDQGTGGVSGADVESVHLVESHADASDPAQWDFRLQNHASGQAQVHLFVVCVKATTTVADGHEDHLIDHGLTSGSFSFPAGRSTQTVSCDPGEIAVAPGFRFNPPAPHGSQFLSEPTSDGSGWKFGFDQSGPNTVELSVRCLERAAYDPPETHYDVLTFHKVYGRATVNPYSPGESQPYRDSRLTCPDGYKGITASWDLPKGMKQLGNTPEPINRDFRLLNTKSRPLYANLDLLCLKVTTRDDLSGGDIKNDATVYSDEPDWSFQNDLSSYVLHDPPDTTAPDTTITMEPDSNTTKRRAKFKFRSSEPGSTFECSLDGADFSPCVSPFKQRVSRAAHTFRVRATDGSGNTDETPAQYAWTVLPKS